MRNLKKALSLALASVMLLGMMVVGTSAAAYPDVDAADNVEAIEVLKAIGVMSGDDNGKFNPDQKVTRNEMAVIMTNLLGLDAKDYAGVHPFTDVPAWADDFVSAAYANGIVSGASATEYNGAAGVTAVEAGLMVMKALGYFQYGSDFGTDWMTAVVKQADKIDLYKGIETGAKAALTRNEVAQLALNGLKATMVDDNDNGIGLDAVGNLVSKYDYVKVYSGAAYNQDIAVGTAVNGEYTIELGEYLYKGDLKLNAADALSNADDDFGRDVSFWNYKTEDVCATTVTPTYEFVVTSVSGTKAALEGQLKALNKNTQFTDAADNAGDANSIVWVNGLKMTSSAYTPAKGDIVEVYCATGDKTNVQRVIVRQYTLNKITKVDTDVNTTDAANDVTAYIDLNTDTDAVIEKPATHDTAIAGFNAETYVKDAYIAAAWNNAGTAIIDSYVVGAPVEGVVSAYVDDAHYTVNGTKYEAGPTYSGYDAYNNAADYEGTYAFYLDENGYVLGSEVVKATQVVTDAVYVLAMYAVDGSASYGKDTKDFYAQTVDMNGVIKNEKIGYTTSAGKIVGVDDTGYTYTEAGTIESGEYFVLNDGTITNTFSQYANRMPGTDVGYTRSGSASIAVAAGNLYTVGENTTDKISELTAYTGTSTIKIGTQASVTGYATTDTKTGTLSGISAPAYLTADTKYIIAKGTLDGAKVTVKTGADVALTVGSTTITVIANKVGTSYEAAYIILPTASYTAGIENDRLYIASTTATDVKEGKQITVYDMAGNTKDIVVTATEYTNDVAANAFFTYSVNDKGVYDLTAIGEMTVSTKVWDKNLNTDKGVALDATFVSLYNGTFSMTDTGTLADIAADKVVIVDKHETVQDEFVLGSAINADGTPNAGQNTYAGKVTTLEALASVTESGYTVTFSVSITEDGAQFIYIREISK